MKKVINGKLYDTDTAKEICTWSNENFGDFTFCEETLFQKRTGEFFIYGEGGPLSMYAVQTTDGARSGAKILPIDYEGAQMWVEDNGTAEQYKELFGDPVEDDTRKVSSLSMSAAAWEKAKRAAARDGVTVSAWIEKVIEANV